MQEEEKAEGLLTGNVPDRDAPPADPLEAVMAVAGPKEEQRRSEAAPAGAGAEGEEIAEVEIDDYGEFEWPEGYRADPEALGKFVPLAKRLGLPKESAQELAGLYADLDRERSRAQAEFIAKNNAEWLREVEQHPEFGGANLRRAGENVATLMRRYGSPLLLSQMRQMNIQNWPEMFYFLARVSQATAEDCSPAGTGARAAARSTAQLLFPDLR